MVFNEAGRITRSANGGAVRGDRPVSTLGADLANGSTDRGGYLVCPWHGARYNVTTGHMTPWPRRLFAEVQALTPAARLVTTVLPLGRGKVTQPRRGPSAWESATDSYPPPARAEMPLGICAGPLRARRSGASFGAVWLCSTRRS